jgi:hypothetical protein
MLVSNIQIFTEIEDSKTAFAELALRRRRKNCGIHLISASV